MLQTRYLLVKHLLPPFTPFYTLCIMYSKGAGYTYIHSGKPTIALAILVLNPTSIPYKIGSLALVDFQNQAEGF